MVDLDKNHNPSKNAQLISKLLGKTQNIQAALKETDQLFLFNQDNNQDKLHQKSILKKIYHFPFAVEQYKAEPVSTYTDQDDQVFPVWKQHLDEEYAHLLDNIKTEVNVEDFGAIGDGVTDNTAAFKRAFKNGRVKVHVPEGVFVTKEIRLPSWTCLVGAGKGLTTIKLHDEAPIAARLVTNSHHWRGNHHIFVSGMSLDWNVERLGNAEKTSTWGNHSSCLTFAHVTFGWVKEVQAINAGLHAFDITSTLYNYAGDGFRARRGSKYIWLDRLNGYGFGDDGITTHHSDFVFISNCHMCDPSGRAHQKGNSNSNGIEIDDGSQNILLVDNSTARCFGGVEIKAHEDSSAASNVQIVGHISVNDNRSYNFRHIGHHKHSDLESKTAENIKATNIVAIAPIFSELYRDSAPRALVVSAYRNVVINNFSLMGDVEYDYQDHPMIAIQYRARNIVLNNITSLNFKTAGADIKVVGGAQRADNVFIANGIIKESAKQAINIGTGIRSVKIKKIDANCTGGSIGLYSRTPHIEISEFRANGYQIPIQITKMNSHK